MRPREIFLSHATADKTIARKLIRALEAEGLEVWFAPYRLVGSQKWHDEIGKALERCGWFALLLSKESVRSRWVKHELRFALNDPKYEDRIVPILIEDCDWQQLSWVLGAIQRVDFRGGFNSGRIELLRIWEPRRRKRSRAARGRKKRS